MKQSGLTPARSHAPACARRCIECGFCESNCPSRDVTITPRQRITVFREMHRLKTLPAPNAAEKERWVGGRWVGVPTVLRNDYTSSMLPLGGREGGRRGPALGAGGRASAQAAAQCEHAGALCAGAVGARAAALALHTNGP